MPESDVIDTLAICIEAVEDGRLSIADCMAEYPDYAESLASLLPLAITLRQAPSVAPAPAFRQVARGRLLQRLPPQTGSQPFWANVQQTLASLWARPKLNSLARLAFLVLVAFSLIGGSLAYADGAVPGDSFYELDRSFEGLRLQLAADDTTAAYLNLTYSYERLLEAKELFGQGKVEEAKLILADYETEVTEIEEVLHIDLPKIVEVSNERLSTQLDNILPTATPTLTATPVMTPTATPTLSLVSTVAPSATPTDTVTATPTATVTPLATVMVTACTGATDHPRGTALANQLAVTYDEIMGWFCAGFGFGEIERAYALSEETDTAVDEIFALRQEGLGWGKIRQQLLGANDDQGNNGNSQNNGNNGQGNGNNGQGDGNNGQGNGNNSGNGNNGQSNGNNGQGNGGNSGNNGQGNGNNGQSNGNSGGNGQGNGNNGQNDNNGGGKKNK